MKDEAEKKKNAMAKRMVTTEEALADMFRAAPARKASYSVRSHGVKNLESLRGANTSQRLRSK